MQKEAKKENKKENKKQGDKLFVRISYLRLRFTRVLLSFVQASMLNLTHRFAYEHNRIDSFCLFNAICDSYKFCCKKM